MNSKELLRQSFKDIKGDFEELDYLITSNLDHLAKFKLELNSSKNFIYKKTFQLVLENVKKLTNNYTQYSIAIKQFKALAKNKKYSLRLFNYLVSNKNSYYDLVRSQQTILGALITSTDWQSPSYIHSLQSIAGRQTGKIIGTINDYKRDAHLDEREYEKLYLREYLDTRFKFNIGVYMTNSGMAAIATILNFLIMEEKIKRKVILGKSVYFQYKQLVVKSLPGQIIEVDEIETDKIIQTIEQERPSVIFFDSLCNSANIALPNLEKIINYLVRKYREEVYLVIDNTCLTTAFQPMKMIVGKTDKVHLILFESLMKYLQLGLDRVTGGIIAAFGRDIRKIFEYRKHSGTNISDSSVYAIPRPNRSILNNRLGRYQRNVSLLASYLQEYIGHKSSVIESIIYPGLPNHPAYQWAKKIPFHGCFFNISFRKKYERTSLYKKFINLVINEAKKQNLNLVAGTSFGLNTTRIYLTSVWTDYGKPFVRVAVGTENRIQVETLKEIFVNSIDKFHSPVSSLLLNSLNLKKSFKD